MFGWTVASRKAAGSCLLKKLLWNVIWKPVWVDTCGFWKSFPPYERTPHVIDSQTSSPSSRHGDGRLTQPPGRAAPQGTGLRHQKLWAVALSMNAGATVTDLRRGTAGEGGAARKPEREGQRLLLDGMALSRPPVASQGLYLPELEQGAHSAVLAPHPPDLGSRRRGSSCRPWEGQGRGRSSRRPWGLAGGSRGPPPKSPVKVGHHRCLGGAALAPPRAGEVWGVARR